MTFFANVLGIILFCLVTANHKLFLLCIAKQQHSSRVVTISDYASGRPGSSPGWVLIFYKARSLHRAYLSLYPSGVVHRDGFRVGELNITGCIWGLPLIDGCSFKLCLSTDSVASSCTCHRNKVKIVIAMAEAIVMA